MADFSAEIGEIGVGVRSTGRPIMAMIDFAVLALKVSLFVWAAQLIWTGSHLLEHLAKRVLRSIPTSDRSRIFR